jgi:membrane protein required for colicin V production
VSETATLNWADWLIIGVLLLSAVVSLLRGLVVEVASLAIAILGALLAFHFASPVANQFLQGIDVVPLRTGIAALGIYILTSVVGALLLYLIKRLVQTAGLSGTDRLLGLVFGVARGLLVVVALFWVGMLVRFDQSDWWQQSRLMPGVAQASGALLLFLPANVREMIANPETSLSGLPTNWLPGMAAPPAQVDPSDRSAVEAPEAPSGGEPAKVAPEARMNVDDESLE